MCENCVKNQWRYNGDSPSVIRPASIYSPKSYNARLDSACARVVKSARFEAPKSLDLFSLWLVWRFAIKRIKLLSHVDVIADNIIERIASLALKSCVVAMVD